MTIPKDKLLHFVAGSIASALAYLLFQNLTLAIGVSVALGVGKEVYDAQGHGTVEVLDAVVTVLGGVVGIILIKAAM